MATERPIDTKEVAEMLGVTPRTVTRLAERGEIPGFKVGDVWRFHRQDILELHRETETKTATSPVRGNAYLYPLFLS